MIRRGNHFILLEDAGWVLIDGPWFHYLTSTGHPYVELACPEETELAFVDDLPVLADHSFLVWERIKWNPGWLFPEEEARKPWVRKYLENRTRQGWRLMPDGPLPAYLMKVDFSPELDHALRAAEPQDREGRLLHRQRKKAINLEQMRYGRMPY